MWWTEIINFLKEKTGSCSEKLMSWSKYMNFYNQPIVLLYTKLAKANQRYCTIITAQDHRLETQSMWLNTFLESRLPLWLLLKNFLYSNLEYSFLWHILLFLIKLLNVYCPVSFQHSYLSLRFQFCSSYWLFSLNRRGLYIFILKFHVWNTRFFFMPKSFLMCNDLGNCSNDKIIVS